MRGPDLSELMDALAELEDQIDRLKDGSWVPRAEHESAIARGRAREDRLSGSLKVAHEEYSRLRRLVNSSSRPLVLNCGDVHYALACVSPLVAAEIESRLPKDKTDGVSSD